MSYTNSDVSYLPSYSRSSYGSCLIDLNQSHRMFGQDIDTSVDISVMMRMTNRTRPF